MTAADTDMGDENMSQHDNANNIPEPTLDEEQEWKQHDMSAVKAVFEQHLGMSVDNNCVVRSVNKGT